MSKLTHEVHKRIIELARTLPQLQRIGNNGKPLARTRTRVVGIDDIPKDKHADMALKHGDGWADKKYVLKFWEPILVDHVIMMIDVFNRKGWDGVNQYFTSVNEMASEPKQIQGK